MPSTLMPRTSSRSALTSSSSSLSQRGQLQPLPSRRNHASPPSLRRLRRSRSSVAVPPSAALPPDALSSLGGLAVHASVLAYERVVLPCQNMGCGDAVYRR